MFLNCAETKRPMLFNTGRFNTFTYYKLTYKLQAGTNIYLRFIECFDDSFGIKGDNQFFIGRYDHNFHF